MRNCCGTNTWRVTRLAATAGEFLSRTFAVVSSTVHMVLRAWRTTAPSEEILAVDFRAVRRRKLAGVAMIGEALEPQP